MLLERTHESESALHVSLCNGLAGSQEVLVCAYRPVDVVEQARRMPPVTPDVFHEHILKQVHLHDGTTDRRCRVARIDRQLTDFFEIAAHGWNGLVCLRAKSLVGEELRRLPEGNHEVLHLTIGARGCCNQPLHEIPE